MIQRFLIFLILALASPAFASLNKSAASRITPDLRPHTQYEITVDIKPNSLSYSGHEKLKFINNQQRPTSYLLFFLYPNDPSLTKTKKQFLTVSNIQLNGAPAIADVNGPFLKISLKEPLRSKASVTVDLDFDGTVPAQTQQKDLFSESLDQLLSILSQGKASQQDYGIFSSSKDMINLGLWYPILSKYDNDGWDEEKYAGMGDVSYFDPADFKVTILAPFDLHVVTSGSETRRIPQKEQKMRHEIDAPMSRDFEIELSTRYQEATRLKDATTIKAFFLPEHAESGQDTLQWATRAFEYYETAFGPYPYSELDVVEAPLYGGAGGVEFPGLVTISSMLYRNSSEQEEDDLLKRLLAENGGFDQLLEFVVAHEVAHQWWNAVVGSNSKRNPFIDEAMANYSAVLYFEHYHGRAAAEQQMAIQMKVNYQLHRLIGGADKPVRLPASSFNGPLEYSAIVYGKGALYFDHLRELMGDAAFLSAFQKYYERFWFRIAAPEDLMKIAQQQSPQKATQIATLFKRWMDEKHGDEDIGAGTFEGIMNTIMSSRGENTPANFDDLMKQLDDLVKQ